MCWHVYYYNIFVAQFVHKEHATDFCNYNQHCMVIRREKISEKNLYTDRFNTIEIELALRVALERDWL